MASDIEAMEDNEWSFCSLWTRKFRVGCARALVNEKLAGDYFFNRATVECCRPAPHDAIEIAKIFWERGMDCYLYFLSNPESKELAARMKKIDRMRVFKSAAAGNGVMHEQSRTAVKVLQLQNKGELHVWVDVFCRSFGVPDWKEEVERMANVHFEELALLLAYRDGRPAGCAALYKKGGVTGLYCLGTIASYRRAGIAKDILRHAQSAARRSGSTLFLQTLESEGLAGLYEKSGFKGAYAKQIFALSKPGPAAG